jgi:hypothetical protein
MDVAGKVNLFIWELSATLHSSSSFSVCRSDFRLVHQNDLRQEVMSQVLAGFSDQCFSFFIPVCQWSTSCGTGGVPSGHNMHTILFIHPSLEHQLWYGGSSPGHTMYSFVYDDHCGISYTYPIFPCRTTDWIDCCRADFAVYMFLGGTI